MRQCAHDTAREAGPPPGAGVPWLPEGGGGLVGAGMWEPLMLRRMRVVVGFGVLICCGPKRLDGRRWLPVFFTGGAAERRCTDVVGYWLTGGSVGAVGWIGGGVWKPVGGA